MFLFWLLFLLPSLILLFIIHYFWSNSDSGRTILCKRVLLVIAHPDDEAMFFAPTIIALSSGSPRCDIYVLCLSSGNYRRAGKVRKGELGLSCQELGIPIGNVTVVEHSRLPDDPCVLWSKDIVRQIILGQAERLGADTLISFDDYGVSGHRNHCAIYRALQSLYSNSKLAPETQVLVLESVGILRKYTGILDIIPSRLSSTFCVISTWGGIVRAQRAMIRHWSQMFCFRFLYIFFSRYMVVNTLRRIPMEKHHYKYALKKDQ